MWSHILTNQLMVSADEFWACVKKAEFPDRGVPQPPPAKKAVPLFLIEALRERGVDDSTILALDPAGAAALLSTKYVDEQSDIDSAPPST